MLCARMQVRDGVSDVTRFCRRSSPSLVFSLVVSFLLRVFVCLSVVSRVRLLLSPPPRVRVLCRGFVRRFLSQRESVCFVIAAVVGAAPFARFRFRFLVLNRFFFTLV